MGLNAYMAIDGMPGSARGSHVKGKCVVHGVRSDAMAEISGEKSFPIAGYKYTPMVVTKQVDLATPKLHLALSAGTVIARVDVEFWRMPPPGGPEELYYKVSLFDVYVTGVKTVLYNVQRPEYAQLPLFEEVTFVFDSIGYDYNGCDFAMNSRRPNRSAKLKAEFEPSAAAKAKAVAIDLGKSASSALAGDYMQLLFPEPQPPQPPEVPGLPK